MTNQELNPGPGTVWAYAYEFMQPQAEDRMRGVQGLLNREKTEARKDARSWGSRFVTENQVTRILIVSDSPRQDLEVNRRLEAELGELKADFFITAALAIGDTAALAIGDEEDVPAPPPVGRPRSPSR
jgi:hypothetical protein